MIRIPKLLILSALLVIVAVPLVAAAQTVGPTQADQGGGTFGGLFPIVPCGTSTTDPCTPCGLLDVLENIVKFVTVGVTGPVAALLFIYAGVLYLTSAGNMNRVQQAKKVLTNTVYGVTIILLSWLVVVQLIKIIAPGSAADRWYEFNCPSFLLTADDIPEVPEPRLVAEGQGAIAQLPAGIRCDEYSLLAAAYGGQPDVTRNAPELEALISCLMGDPVVEALANHPDNSHTFETSNPACNATRGVKTPCTPACKHTVGSCHYGGKTGTTGAQAIDLNSKDGVTVYFNWQTRDVVSGEYYRDLKTKAAGGDEAAASEFIKYTSLNGDPGLAIAIKWVAANRCQGLAKRIAFETHHVHVSTMACDSDGKTDVSAFREN